MKLIDLGLSVKWTDCNIGAHSSEGYGSLFSYGEIVSKDDYSLMTYKYNDINKNFILTKYNINRQYGIVDNKIILDFEDDAAYVNSDSMCRIPTNREWSELRKQCNWTWVNNYNDTGVAGYIVTSKINNNFIFLPAAGYHGENGLRDINSCGFYLSNLIDIDYPYFVWGVYFYSDYVQRHFNFRYIGQSIRAVSKQ